MESVTGEVVKHGDLKCIYNEGMPTYKNPFEKGRLILQISVKFPESNWMNPEKLTKLEKYLPPRQEVIIPDDAEECALSEFTVNSNSSSRRHHRGGEAYMDDDDDGNPHGQRVQCASH